MVVKLTANEWQILRIVWELESCGAREVCVVAKDQFGWAPTTVKTYLKLLVEKGRLSAEKRGNRFLYRPTASAKIGLREAADTFLEKVVGGTESSLLAYMIRKSDLTPNDIRELRQFHRELGGKPVISYLLGGIFDGMLALGFVWAVWFWQRERVPARVAWWLFALALAKCVIPLELALRLPENSSLGQVVAIAEPGLMLSGRSELGLSVPEPGSRSEAIGFNFAWLLLGGLGISLGLFALRWLQTLRVVSRAQISGAEVCVPGLGAVQIAHSRELRSPAVWGWRRPIVLLPQGLDRHLNREHLDWVIAHECAHWRRGDIVSGFLTRLLRAVFFFNPAIWLALRMMDKLAEQDCDRMASQALGMEPQESARSFLAVAAWTAGDRSLAPGLSASARSAKQRLVDLLQAASRRPLSIGGFVVLLIALLLVVPSFRPREFDGEAVGALEARVAQLEEELRVKSTNEQRRERNVGRARERVAADVARIGTVAVHEAELLYQSAKKKVTPGEIEEAMAPLLERFPESNRAGCGALFLARMQAGGSREGLLSRCVDEWGDCYFLDGTSVGGMARLYLSRDHKGTREGRDWLAELRSEFADAIDFSGASLLEVAQK